MSPFGHMSPTRYRTLAGLCWALGALGAVSGAQSELRPASTLPTQPATRPQNEEYWLRVTAETLNLRSRPDTNSVPVIRLERDAVLRAVGSQFGWHKVVPPEGVFSYVSAAHVARQGETEGIVSVTSGALRVRVGSLIQDVDPAGADVQTVLERGTSVRILGAAGEWLKIAPPAGVYAYAADAYVTRVDDDVAARLMAQQGVASRPVQATASRAAARPVRPASVPTTTAPDLSGPWGQRLVLVEAAIETEADPGAILGCVDSAAPAHHGATPGADGGAPGGRLDSRPGKPHRGPGSPAHGPRAGAARRPRAGAAGT